MLSLSHNDNHALEQHDLSISQVEAQIQQLRDGIRPIQLVRPCLIGDGIVRLSPQQITEYHKLFHSAHDAGRISKFIPASGAATRMFKDVLQFIEKEPSSQTTKQKDLTPPESIVQAWEQLHHFPFIHDLQQHFDIAGIDFKNLYDSRQMSEIFQALLHIPGLGYATLPKALLPFHRYPECTRTSLEEHIEEARLYSRMAAIPIRIHLTISGQFEAQVKTHMQAIQTHATKIGIKLDLTLSVQKPSTDTLALDAHNQLFRDQAGTLVFRPGGHGALLENLNDYEGDIVCISNIDNVVPDHLKMPIVEWRMSLAGFLIELQEHIFHHMTQLATVQPTTIQNAEVFVQRHLHHQFSESYNRLHISEKATWLNQFLHRPIRVCGVVPNTGDAGGGPFWVQHADGSQSRQIVEQSQADPHSELQQQLFTSATHFNPVDMVCGVRDAKGHSFNLLRYSDPETSFISHKSYEGRPLKALEWPGLWNGGMADWITLFVEIPRSTFNPVKAFTDWLQPHHQPPN